MKAMILAAGLGTRLRPLTDNRPKALVEISGRTLLEITLSRLRALGISEVIINVHHFADMILEYLKSHKNFGMRIEISREDLLLDTGGGLKEAAWFFLEDSSRVDRFAVTHSIDRSAVTKSIEEPFLLHNVDVISTIDLRRMLQFHSENQALATLAVQDRESSRYLLFDDHLQLRGRRSSGTANPGCAPQITAMQNESVRKRDSSQIAPPSAPAEKVTPFVIPSEARDLLLGRKGDSSRDSASEVQSDSGQTHSDARHSSAHRLHPLAFSGIHVISPRLLPMIAEQGVFSIIDTYLRLATHGEKILAFRADEYYWRDLGRPVDLTQAAHDLQQKALE